MNENYINVAMYLVCSYILLILFLNEENTVHATKTPKKCQLHVVQHMNK